MTTPTTMTKSIITTATTMITDVVVAPSLGGLLVGCMLLLAETVPVVVVAPSLLVSRVLWLTETLEMIALSFLVGCMLHMTRRVVVSAPTVWGGVVSSGIDAVERKHTTRNVTQKKHQMEVISKGQN